MASCSICKLPAEKRDGRKDNIIPEKVITCALCVQRLLAASDKVKREVRNHFLSKGDEEAARSVQSFIAEDGLEDTENPEGMVTYRPGKKPIVRGQLAMSNRVKSYGKRYETF